MNKFRKPHGNRGRNEGRFSERGEGRHGFGRPPQSQFRGEHSENRQSFDAVCSNCGRACKLPFRPNGTKPVYCNDCFSAHRQGSSNRESFPRRDIPMRPVEPQGENKMIIDLKRQVDALNVKIDSVLRILTVTPRGAAPVEVAASEKTDSRRPIRKDSVKTKKKITKKTSA